MTERSDTTRYDALGPIRVMAHVDGYVMLRRPHRRSFVLSDADWKRLPSAPVPAGAAWPRVAGDHIDTGPDGNGSFT